MTSVKNLNGVVVVSNEQGEPLARVLMKGDQKKTALAIMRQLTNNGLDLYLRLHDIGMGKAHVVKLPDGRETAPMVPSFDTQRQALKELIEFMHGKAVPQTEVVKAMQQQSEAEQISALTEDQLWRIVSEKRNLLADDTDPTSDK